MSTLDFLDIIHRETRKDFVEFEPEFLTYNDVGTGEITDLMTRGGDFYAVWVEERKMWSTKESDATKLIDRELHRQANEFKEKNPEKVVKVKTLKRSSTGSIDRWHRYVKQQLRENFIPLDEKIIFSNMETVKTDYASKKLSYPLVKGEHPCWDKLIGTLYSETERHKIEWAIGAIVSGASKTLQKFIVFYGAGGTGKSTILKIIAKLFDGYCTTFDAKALGSSTESFSLEPFACNPLVAIQYDGDLSRIEDNTRINSIVAHEPVRMNEKHKTTYAMALKCFLLLGSNKPVKITDAKSGIIRRLIDVTPSGNKLISKEYRACVSGVQFELGAIAEHCLGVFNANPSYYDDYIPINMMERTNDFYNFMLDGYSTFKEEDGITFMDAWKMYLAYCDEANIPLQYRMSQRPFKSELSNYFDDYKERITLADGSRPRSYYKGFKANKFTVDISEKPKEPENPVWTPPDWLNLKEQPSILDDILKDCPAQEATEFETPKMPWDSVKTTLKDISTRKLHYLLAPETHIFIDFDLKDESGNKSYEANQKAASSWPRTYAETSKSDAGIHLHYIYDGDPNDLAPLFAKDIEIKICTGKKAIRRKLTRCNNEPVATISSGLPLKGEKILVDQKQVASEEGLIKLIKRNLNKEIVASTKSSIDFIYNDLQKAYDSGLKYDVSRLYNAVLNFAMGSTHQADYCIQKVMSMKFRSGDDPEDYPPAERKESDEEREKNLVFYDVEIFRPDKETGNPGLFLICYKKRGNHPVVRMYNPRPAEVQKFLNYDLVDFNGRNYDRHMTYARANRGYSNEALYNLSQKIIEGDKDAKFRPAYNNGYLDVFDCAATKMSLKKWEIELGEPHMEMGVKWDEPLDPSLWDKAGEYCENDVRATEAVFEHIQPDFTARKILAKITGMTVNDTTNTLTTRFIFGKDKEPWKQFNYRHLGELRDDDYIVPGYDEYTRFNKDGKPVFPGYEFKETIVVDEKTGKTKTVYQSTYRGEVVGEGGYVYSEPGMYGDASVSDSASHHPSSIVAEEFFGAVYTARFKDILDARIAVKHNDTETLKTILGGALWEFVQAGVSMDDLSYALKIAINSVYGLTSAKFQNPFKHPDNHDNFVAKRGALFMINLKHEVQKKGFQVIHIKTDSIKIPDATPEILQFVAEYGKLYGYSFEHEAMYDRVCLVNDACFVAKFAGVEKCEKQFGYIPKDNKKHPDKWEAVAEQFQVPYVFKKLFSHEPIEFKDLCETKSVTTALYLQGIGDDGEMHRRFVGKVGLFTPVVEGCGGRELKREGKDKNGNTVYNYADGTKGYLWMESHMVKELGLEDKIDYRYYDAQVTKAVETIAAYGDFEWFVSDEPYYPHMFDEVLPFN